MSNQSKKQKDYLQRLREGESLRLRELCEMILQLSLPAIMAQISTIIMQYIDASMVGRLGAGGSAAIGLVSSSTWLFGVIAMAAGMGFSVQCAQRIGAGDEADARNLMRQGMRMMLIVAAVMGAVGVFCSSWLPGWLGGGPEICGDASRYFLVFALFFPVERLNYIGGSFLQATGNMLLPGILHVMMCVLDVIFNAFLIFGEWTLPAAGIVMPGAGLGVAGAALGTGLARLCSMCVMLWYLYFRSPVLHLREGEKMRFRRDQILRSLQIALPVAVENVVMNSAQIASTKIVAPLGTVSVAANSLSVTAESLCYMPGYGIAAAATAVIGQCIGAGRYRTTRRVGWITTFLGMGVMTLSGLLMFLFAPQMIGFLSPDPQVVALGTRVLRIEAFAEPMFAAQIVSAGVMRGGGDTFVPALFCLGTMWCIRIPLAMLLASRIGLRGVWIAMCIELCVRGILFLLRQAQGIYLRGGSHTGPHTGDGSNVIKLNNMAVRR